MWLQAACLALQVPSNSIWCSSLEYKLAVPAAGVSVCNPRAGCCSACMWGVRSSLILSMAIAAVSTCATTRRAQAVVCCSANRGVVGDGSKNVRWPRGWQWLCRQGLCVVEYNPSCQRVANVCACHAVRLASAAALCCGAWTLV